MWRGARWSSKSIYRRLYTAARRRSEDEGDWCYSSEWWGTDYNGQTVLRSISDKGNGVVSVIAYPSSRPSQVYWSEMENWLQQRYADLQPGYTQKERFRVIGYQWRVLKFNDDTRQSAVKIMAACKESDPHSMFFMQQPHCLATPYLKSMVSVGLATIAASDYDLTNAMHGKKSMNILCIGHGGGSLPLFLASKIQGAKVHIVEIDPLVISASIQAMGFPAFSLMAPSGGRANSGPDTFDNVLWKGLHERIFLYKSDAEDFILRNSTKELYDMVFIDAYDGDDIFPHKLWDAQSPFLQELSSRIHPRHGTVVVNLHADSDILDADRSAPSVLEHLLPMGKYVSTICRAYKNAMVQSRGSAFVVSVPWVCNSSLVVSKGFTVSGGLRAGRWDSSLEHLVSKAFEVEHLLDLPFPCLDYIKRNLMLVD
ncbi:hypothetical protein SAY86_010740 [Trapa natans]|uniref:S-adenosyl-L-methionine-dependent methyltransferase superfamily protein n=1 Tax=Trapa natans TaxID=22666 RepID=A0AAN7LVV6_TRANT|nr:hypothetical protein SAY86_010740 [Trapa natans]